MTADNFTDWVVEASITTDIDPYNLWQLEEIESEDELEEWADRVSQNSSLERSDLVAVAEQVSRTPEFPTIASTESDTTPADDDELNDGVATEADSAEEFEQGPHFEQVVEQSSPSTGSDRPPQQQGPDADVQSLNPEEIMNRTAEGPSPQDDVVTENEYKQFQEKVQEVVQNLIDFLISYDMLSGNGGNATSTAEDELQAAVTDVDDASEFFENLDTALSSDEADDSVLDELEQVVESQTSQADDDATEELADELKQSIEELKTLQDEFESASSNEQSSRGEGRAQSPAGPHTKRNLSRNSDPHVLNQLNRLTETVREYAFEEDDLEPEASTDGSPKDRQQPTASEAQSSASAETDADLGSRGHGSEQTEQGREQTKTVSIADFIEEATQDTKETLSDSTASRLGFFGIDLAWLFAGITYGGLDMFSTALVLGSGGQELNPIYNILGGSLISFVIWKTFVIFLLFILFYPAKPRQPSATEWLVPIATSVVGLFLMFSNISVLTGGGALI